MTTQLRRFAWNPPLDRSCDGMVSHPLFTAGENGPPPELTIAIPTFGRPALLAETVRSVLAQSDLNRVEILVVDNDPESDGANRLVAMLPELHDRTVRYYRNSRNVGMFGNWNTCITLARGEWLTILNDDDLIDADFVATIRTAIVLDPAADAIVGSVRYMDCRSGIPDRVSGVPMVERVRNVFRYGFSSWRRLRPKGMFFGSLAGSSLALVVRKRVAEAIGGYRSAEYPSADYYFSTRLARDYRFIQLRKVIASVRVDVNESTRPETLLGFIGCQAALQRAMIGREVPARWERLMPISLGVATRHFSSYWRVPLKMHEVAEQVGEPMTLRGDRLFRLYRLLRGAI